MNNVKQALNFDVSQAREAALTNKPMLSVERNTIALEALRAARQFIVNGIELGFISMPEPETPDSAHDTLPMLERAIADLAGHSTNTLESRTYADEPLSRIKAMGELVQDARGINISGNTRKVSAFLLCSAAVPELVARIEELEAVGNE